MFKKLLNMGMKGYAAYLLLRVAHLIVFKAPLKERWKNENED